MGRQSGLAEASNMGEDKHRGQPTKMTPETLKKLDDAFSFCFSDAEACLYAGISEKTLYNFQNKNPKYVQRKMRLRLTPNLAAKRELVAKIKDDVIQARWWAEHKMSDEFGTKTKIEHAGKIQTEDVTPTTETDEAVKQATIDYHNALKAAIIKAHGK